MVMGMTIKKRLIISNILMILVPVCITLLIALGCVGGIWYTLSHGTGLGFDDSKDFFQASQSMSPLVEEALKGSTDEQTAKLSALGSLLDRGAMSLTVEKDGQTFYSYGTSENRDPDLVKAADVLGNNGILSSNQRNLFARTMTIRGNTYLILLFSTSRKLSYGTLKVVIALAAVVLVFTIFLSVLLTDRFLTKFVFQKIAQPLDILAHGVRQIRDGNLDYRIEYAYNDEFAPICTDFNEMAARLRASVELTRRHEESRKELMAGISHDLRSPLTSVRAYVEGLLDGVAKTPAMQKNYLMTIKNKAEDIERMVSQIFLFSKLEMDEYPVESKPLRLDYVVDELLQAYGDEYASHGLKISAKTIPACIAADSEQLRRVLYNIIDNSLKYKVEAIGRLDIILRETDTNYVLTLADDGPGVSPEALPKLFDVFYRSDPARQNPDKGSGLGLAIAARAVERMGGMIWAENGEEGGLAIMISFPKEGELDEQNSDY